MLIVGRYPGSFIVVTSNREPVEWLGQMSYTPLPQSVIDRLKLAACELADRAVRASAARSWSRPSC